MVWGLPPTSQFVQGVLIWNGLNPHTHDRGLCFRKNLFTQKRSLPRFKKKFFSIQKMFYIWRVGGFVWIDIPLYGKDKIHNIAIQVNIYNSLLINNSYTCNVKPIQ